MGGREREGEWRISLCMREGSGEGGRGGSDQASAACPEKAGDEKRVDQERPVLAGVIRGRRAFRVGGGRSREFRRFPNTMDYR